MFSQVDLIYFQILRIAYLYMDDAWVSSDQEADTKLELGVGETWEKCL